MNQTLERGENTYREIMSQPQVWTEAVEVFSSRRESLGDFWQKNEVDQIIFIGCGSTYFLSKTAGAIFQKLSGIPAFSFPGSEALLHPEVVFPKSKNTLLVAVSRSGKTTETVQAVEQYKNQIGGKVISITCDSGSALAEQADFLLAVDAAQEDSIAQTRSFTSMLILAQAMAGHYAGMDLSGLVKLPAIGEYLLSENKGLAQKLGEDSSIDKIFFLGAGMLNGIANEAMLKMKEMSLSYSEAFHTLEFRHGPMSMVDERSLVVGLVSENAQVEEARVLKHMQRLGANILVETDAPTAELSEAGEVVLLKAGLPGWLRTVLYLPVLQLLAYYRSISKGLDPDRPSNLDAVVQLPSLMT